MKLFSNIYVYLGLNFIRMAPGKFLPRFKTFFAPFPMYNKIYFFAGFSQFRDKEKRGAGSHMDSPIIIVMY